MNPLKARVERLRSLLRRKGQRPENAEDLVQEAFLRLQIYCNEGHEVHSPDAFLLRTALNLAVNVRQGDHSHLYVDERPEELELVAISPTPDEVFAAEECLSKVERKLLGLSRRTRDVFMMHRLEGLSYAQIADHFDISVSAIEKHIANAMAVLGPLMHQESKRR